MAKRKKKADAHHGGAWKVAYADFVTAMMALFMVLWISAQDKEILIATSQYFISPFTSPLDASSGVLPLDSNKLNTQQKNGEGQERSGGQLQTSPKEVDMKFLKDLAQDFYRLLHVEEDLKDKPIDILVTNDGMHITLFDRTKKPLFKEGTTEFTEWGDFAMQSLAWLIDRYEFNVVIDGHTRTGAKNLSPSYTAWELSADRANAARRALTHYAVQDKLIQRVTGYADTKPMANTSPEDESNQRVTLNLSLTQQFKPKSLTLTQAK